MRPRFAYGEAVRVIRSVRNDGTYPGLPTGALLVRCGTVGYVRDVGAFLQDQVIYSVHFLTNGRVVGCRAEELIAAAAPWVPTRFEPRDRVAAARALAVGGEVIAAPGRVGEVLRVLRGAPGGPAYHVRMAGRTLEVPEAALTTAPGSTPGEGGP